MTATNRRHDAMPGKNRSFRLFHAAVIATVGVVGLAYWPSMHAPVLFDDVLEIESNRALRVLWPPHVAMFQGGKLPHRPLAYYTFALNRLYGLDTFGFRAVNLGLHLVNGVLVGWLAAAASRRLCPQEERTETGWLGWAIATLWLLHPLCTQPVAYVYQRMELVGATAILTTLACFERSRQRPAHARSWQAGAVALLAVVCVATTHARLHAYRTRLDLWRDMAAKRPDNPRAWLCIGRIILDEGNAESAGIFFARALQLRPDYVDALFQMGNAVRGRSPEVALEWYRRTLALRPDHVDAHNNVAAPLGIRGDPAAAEHLRIALAIDPVNVEAHSNFGNIMLASGRLAEARYWFAKAFALDPESLVTGQNLAVVERLLAAKAPPPRPSQGDPQ